MEKIVAQTLLYDFYGELLTEHQRQIYEEAVMDDLSLGEIAQEYGISRQGVHDLVKRCDRILQEYEDKLQLIRKFHQTAGALRAITDLTDAYLAWDGEQSAEGKQAENPRPSERSDRGREIIEEIRKLTDEIAQLQLKS